MTPEILTALSRGDANIAQIIEVGGILHDAIDKLMAKSPEGKQPPALYNARRAAEQVLGQLNTHKNKLESDASAIPPKT